MDQVEIIPKGYLCNNCSESIIAPKHCGKPMNLRGDTEIGYIEWICWKGEHEPCCGRESVVDFESCCSKPHLKAGKTLNSENKLKLL